MASRYVVVQIRLSLFIITFFVIQLTDICTMLSERKRFNYMVNNSHQNTSRSINKQPIPSVLKTPLASIIKEDKENASRVRYDDRQNRQNLQKIEQLQNTNKKLIEQTTNQFKKLQSDVHRVQKILEEKEIQIVQVKKQKRMAEEELDHVSQEKKILIEAIFEKDLVIRHYEMKIKQLLQHNKEKLIMREQTTPHQEEPTTATINFTQAQVQFNSDFSMQTEPLPEVIPIQDYNSIVVKNQELEDELYKTKEDLFDATNKSKLMVQQFQAYKILRQIQSIQNS